MQHDPLMLNYRVLKFFANLYAVFPLANRATKIDKFIQTFTWYFFHVNYWILGICIINAVYEYGSDVSRFLTCCVELVTVGETIALMIIYKLLEPQLQVLLKEIEELSDTFTGVKESILIQKYIKKYYTAFGVLSVLYLLLAFIYVYKSLFVKPVQLLSIARYPFKLESTTLWIFIYIHQVLIVIYAPAIFAIDGIIVMLILVACIRLELLKSEFKNINKHFELAQSVQIHQDIIRFAEKVCYISRFFIFKSIFSSTIYVISGGLQVFSSGVLELTQIQFILVSTISFFRMYVYSFYAECFTTSGYDLGFAVYSSHWYNQSRGMILSKSIMIRRCQKPLHISINGIMPSLGMNYFRRFTYLTFSYITTLKAITET